MKTSPFRLAALLLAAAPVALCAGTPSRHAFSAGPDGDSAARHSVSSARHSVSSAPVAAPDSAIVRSSGSDSTAMATATATGPGAMLTASGSMVTATAYGPDAAVTASGRKAEARVEPASNARRNWPDWLPKLSGTFRGKWEWQPNEKENRFEVRTARVALDGFVVPIVEYRFEIDLSDEGRIRMLDAFAGVLPAKALELRIGQMRVPFSIDAHRSPHKQYFANRSFIAKQVGDVRDVGLYGGYTVPGTGLVLEAGLFNGSGLTNQKDYWTKTLNYSAKVQYKFPFGLTLQASTQKVSPDGGDIFLYDGGATLQLWRFTLEAEYLRKHYKDPYFKDVNAFDSFICYDQPLRRVFRKMSFLCRYDAMGDHSDGSHDPETGRLKLTDAKRQRLTGGITLSLAKKMNADIRLNYEKYFYDRPALAKPSERDKAVIELVIHFPND